MTDEKVLSQLFQALADPTRLRIVRLVRTGAPSATELNQALRMSQPRVAHHLKILVTAGLVIAERDGRFVRYYPARQGLESALLELASGSTAASTAPGSRSRVGSRSEMESQPTAPEPSTPGSPGISADSTSHVDDQDEVPGRRDLDDFLL